MRAAAPPYGPWRSWARSCLQSCSASASRCSAGTGSSPFGTTRSNARPLPASCTCERPSETLNCSERARAAAQVDGLEATTATELELSAHEVDDDPEQQEERRGLEKEKLVAG
mmetsp:Transcript_44581/g.110515  ORF Transcript_44581/g.110515 Transcript_44581/m.110515 type:complete len:113 (-) Transcript_44581:360-698(-)